MTTLETTTTVQKLADMFTENTGKGLLDSGGAYGRNWERNQGKTASDFMSAPAGFIDSDGEITLDAFHYLNDRISYEAPLDAAWREFDAERPDASWDENISEFLDMLGVSEDAGLYDGGRFEFNTYNFDGCLLSQTLQGVAFTLNGDQYLLLQVHGGCDVRGGYTKPVVFSGDVDSVIIDANRAYVRCYEDDCEFYASFEGSCLEDWYLQDSKATPDMLIETTVPTEWAPDKDWHAGLGCPMHHTPLSL